MLQSYSIKKVILNIYKNLITEITKKENKLFLSSVAAYFDLMNSARRRREWPIMALLITQINTGWFANFGLIMTCQPNYDEQNLIIGTLAVYVDISWKKMEYYQGSYCKKTTSLYHMI